MIPTRRIDQPAVLAALRGAVPYIRLYRGKVFVIKAGDSVFRDAVGCRSLLGQVGILYHLGIRVVLVHGDGLRLDALQGSLREICRACGIDAVSLSDVEASILRVQLDAGLIPIVSPPTFDSDLAAASIGAALGAEKLLFCAAAPGILEHLDDPGSLISYTDLAGLARLDRAGSLVSGLLPTATAIEAAIRGGVRRVHVISHLVRDSVLTEVFTNEGTGTMIVDDIHAMTPAEQLEAVAS